jgi:hypothetical protein
MKHLGNSYESVMKMPTYERRFFIDMLIRENNAHKEHVQGAQQTTQSGKGKRTRKISGNAVKEYSGKV